MKKLKKVSIKSPSSTKYADLQTNIIKLVEAAKGASSRAINILMTTTYWEIGRHIVEFEQSGATRAVYGTRLITRLGHDLTKRLGRGFSADNLESMRLFYSTYLSKLISESMTRKSNKAPSRANISESLTRKFVFDHLATIFPLSWTHYVHLIRRCETAAEREFYEAEALRGGWPVRTLDRQIATKFYQRTLLSHNKATLLKKESKPRSGEALLPEEAIKDPYILEFLDLKDEYSESDLEAALIHKLENFLLELGDDFAFIGRQRRLRVGTEWYRIDLLFFHRRLRCLVIVDLKLGKFTHADVGQMHLYLNYARGNWMHEGENPPVGLILCAQKDAAVAHYSLEGLPNKVLAAEYKLALPNEARLVKALTKARKLLQ